MGEVIRKIKMASNWFYCMLSSFSISRRCSRKQSANLLGPAVLTMLGIKQQVLHRMRAHLKVPGWFLDLNALQTRNLPMFLLRLNEISGV